MKRYHKKIFCGLLHLIIFVAIFPVSLFGGIPLSDPKIVRFYGKVIDRETGSPLAGASVIIAELNHGDVTDAKGAFSFEKMKAGQYTVVCQIIGYEKLKAVITLSDKNLKQDFYLTPSPIAMPEVTVTGEKNKAGLTESSQSLVVLTPRELDKHRGQTLGETLKEIPGVTVLQTGPSIAKPVIRGLHSQRILVLNAGVAQEGQQWGGEHAPEIDPFAPARVEVLKGAAGVQYGSGAIGGVIRVEPRDLREISGLGGQLALNAFSNNLQGAGSLMLENNVERFPGLAWRIQGSLRKAGDAKTPDYRLRNSAFDERDWSTALGYHRERRGVELYYSHFGTDLGIFRGAHIGNVTDLLRAIERGRPSIENDFSYEVKPPKQDISHNLLSVRSQYEFPKAGRLEMQYGWQQNHRQEFDAHKPFSAEPPTTPSFDLTLTTYTADLTFQHNPIDNFFGKIGLSGMRQGNVQKGTVFLIPNFRAYNGGIFLIENWVRGAWTLEVGARYDYRWVKVFQLVGGKVDETIHRYSNASGVVGLIYQFAPTWSIGANVGTAWRPPSLNELYSNGVHHGTAQFEIGDSNLNSERSLGIDATLRHIGEKNRAEISVYNNRLRDFIFLFPQPEPTLTIRGAFPTFRYQQADAVIRGFDGAVQHQFTDFFELGASVAVVRGQNRDTDEPLFQMPADRFRLFANWNVPMPAGITDSHLDVIGTFVRRQTRVPPNADYAEAPAPYALLDLSFGCKLKVAAQSITLDLGIQNLLDTAYRDYLSRYRYFADDPGRGLILRVQVPFGQFEQ
jgi:iron complex outermembrane receptor protein